MLKNKKVLVLGLARSGNAAVRLLQQLNANITINVYDKEVKEYDLYTSQGIEMIVGEHPQSLFEKDFDFVVKNPGIKYNLPFIKRLKERGIPIYSEIELGYQYAKKQNYVALTGTNGKTTTVTLIYDILCAQKENVHLAGNIGKPLCDVIVENNLLEKSDHTIVLELSNFQLLDIHKFRSDASMILNLTPDHLDYMESLDEYYTSKTFIYKNQVEGIYVNNLDDPILQDYLTKYPPKTNIVTMSLNQEANCMIKDNTIIYNQEEIINLEEIKVVGKHNVSNIMAAICLTKAMGITNKILYQVIRDFTGVQHRIEYVTTINGNKVYNDSKATNTDATIIALNAFEKPVILLLGGFEKGLDMTPVKALNHKIKTLITFGNTKERFNQDMQHPHTIVKNNLKEATSEALKQCEGDDIILLSPSTSSFDEFKSYEQRGQVFKQYIYEANK